jgi:hypothetical protein
LKRFFFIFQILIGAICLSRIQAQEKTLQPLNLDSLRLLDSLAVLDSLIVIDSVAIDITAAKVDSLYPFISYRENKIEFYGSDFSNSGYEHFFDVMAQLQRGKKRQLNIVHIGGSHIQADVWSGETRRLLREWIPANEGARGFVFPQKLARSNGSPNFLASYSGWWSYHKNIIPKLEYPIGLSGVSAATHDSLAHLTLTLVGERHIEFPYPQYYFTRAKIFHNTDSTGFFVDIDSAVSHTKTVSSGWGYTEFVFDAPQTRLPLKIYKALPHQVQFVLYGINLENDESGFVYSAIGVNGATVPAFLRCSLLERQLKLLQPDLVILSLGVNDSRYAVSYTHLTLPTKA